MLTKTASEKGQALILIVGAIVGLVAITALAIDAGNAFSDRRHAQNAADTAALAAALAKVQGLPLSTCGTYTECALARAAINDYSNDGVNTVEVYTMDNPLAVGCDPDNPIPDPSDPLDPLDIAANYILVTIHSTVDTFFAPIVGINQLSNCVDAIARAKLETQGPLFFGNAVVGLDPDPSHYAFDAWGNSDWYIWGGGVFSNSNARGKNNKDNVLFPDGDCVTAVGAANYFSCPVSQDNPSLFFDYPDDIIPLLPSIPPCDGVSYVDGDGTIHEQAGKEGRGSTVDSFEGDYAPGLYCITNAGGNIHGAITGTGVTFYISDTAFTLRFNGGGRIAAQAPTTGDYAGVLIFSDLTTTPCTQDIKLRGNGSSENYGTIFMPSACIDYRGNSMGNDHSQLIGYRVTSNGSGYVNIIYNTDENYEATIPPEIELSK